MSGRRGGAGRDLTPRAAAELALAGPWPRSVYLSGRDEAAKAELLAWWRERWQRERGGSPVVHRAGEAGVARVLADAQGGSLFEPCVLVEVLHVEEWGRSPRSVEAAAAGVVALPADNSLLLVESAADEERKSLGGLRDACEVAARVDGLSPEELVVWGEGHLRRRKVALEDGVLEDVLAAARWDTAEFLNELDKLADWSEEGKPIGRAVVSELLRPLFAGTLPALARAVAERRSDEAMDQLLRSFEAGESEGTVLFHLQTLFTGALRVKTGKWGWIRDRENASILARSRSEADLSRALDLLYRVERAWKTGRGDERSLLVRAVAGVA